MPIQCNGEISFFLYSDTLFPVQFPIHDVTIDATSVEKVISKDFHLLPVFCE